ncbi:ABC-type transport system substrate-binding protein [Bradyrhizobium sp. GM22.5]
MNARRFPTDDVAVRQAIEYAVDKKGLIQLTDVGVFPASNTPLSKGMPSYDASLENSYPYDLKKTAELLAGAGWEKTGEF